MWRFIVSPEDADRLNLRDHVRELLGRMESDLGTRLDWVAIDHHNTDDAHVHLLVRGVRADGRPLEIDREYLRSGVRTRSQEIATRELGPRLEPEVLRSRERAVRREQWTEIDRALQQRADANRVVSYENFQSRGASTSGAGNFRRIMSGSFATANAQSTSSRAAPIVGSAISTAA